MPAPIRRPAAATSVVTRTNEAPDTLKPYVQHGVYLDYGDNSAEAVGTCPFCSRERKFSVKVETGQWRCLAGCGKHNGGGGLLDFLQQLWDVSEKATTLDQYKTLAADRGLEYPDTLVHWGVVASVINGHWLVPAWGVDYHGKLRMQQLYIYAKAGGRKVLMATSTLKHGLFGLTHYDDTKSDVHVCEGPWDGMRYWEVLRSTKVGTDGEYVHTSSVEHCLLNTVNVVAVPGCQSFLDVWARWFRDKSATFLYDNDHPRTHATTGAELPPPALLGVKHAVAVVHKIAEDVKYLAWGPDGYDLQLANGYDLRDLLSKEPMKGLLQVMTKIRVVPQDWMAADSVNAASGKLVCKNCTTYSLLSNAWRKAMKWTDGLDHALTCMLATIASTNTVGDQLWMKIMGPASCGKSTLCEALSVDTEHVISKSTIRGFHSGYRESSDEMEDNSLINQLRGKTLVTKDGDTLLQTPNLGQVLSEARDLYDRTSRTSYRTKASKDYEGVSWTWLLAGTSSLRSIDSSELGERFLDCVIMDRIDPQLEDDILLRVANKSASSVDIEVNETVRSQHSPELAEAMELTGGYAKWLRNNTSKMLPAIEFSDHAKHQCIQIGKLVAYMRARPSTRQKEKAERELAARLVSQHVRLAKCLALVLNRKAVDEPVMSRVRRVGLDTCRGTVLEITKALYEAGDAGKELNSLMLFVNCGDAELRVLMRFLREIGVVQNFITRNRRAYRLTPVVKELYRSVARPAVNVATNGHSQ